jgi:osmotically-inducible protein OsmY
MLKHLVSIGRNGLAYLTPTGQAEPVTQMMHRTDQELKTAVTEELQYTPDVEASALDVSVEDAKVTLSGTLASLPQRLAAKRAAMRIAGVRAVFDKTVVHTAQDAGPSDQEIATAASQILDWAVEVPANAVKAEVRDHKITLSGQVTWGYQRDAAARAVMYIKGITEVDNTISLVQPAPAPEAKMTVEAAIRRYTQLDPKQINVDINGPELTLRGNVPSLADRRHAEYAAWSTLGVTRVKNELRVSS